MTNRQPKEFESKVLNLARVSRMTAGGRRFRMRAIVVIGDRKGRIGVGLAKGADTQEAVAKASERARRSLIVVPIVNGSIPHEVDAKYGASRIRIKRRPEGFGISAGGAARAVLELAGVRNAAAKFISRTTNALTNARATLKALSALRSAAQTTESVEAKEPEVEEVEEGFKEGSGIEE